ncbi:hypothetical protein IFM89_002331 [Coptis chinensis]|uniref:Hexosyltransferase n=1 Tax=Coptis chinensis TaxID=261450 RepID=A0A835IIY6_9MAGN|nr:hypothetical protein IFM89_002331 [Coptis chinensis]
MSTGLCYGGASIVGVKLECGHESNCESCFIKTPLNKETLSKTNSLESRIRKATKEALKTTKLAGTICICQRPMAQGCHKCLMSDISDGLCKAGYNSAIFDPIGARKKVLDIANSLGLCIIVAVALEVALAESAAKLASLQAIVNDGGRTPIKFRNPKYLSMLNRLRFYIPEVFPALKKVAFLDDDVVDQKDLAPLFSIDLNGNENGAVETCMETFHRYHKYLSYSHPLIRSHFDPDACGWAFGMNIFDLVQWRKGMLLASITIGKKGMLIGLCGSLWHVLGLGYTNVDPQMIEKGAVLHFNGNSKLWLKIGMERYKVFSLEAYHWTGSLFLETMYLGWYHCFALENACHVLKCDISDGLCKAGYNSVICKSKWRSLPDIPSGEHTYIVVVDKNTKKGEVRAVIELNFRAEFEMARASKEYNQLVDKLPEVYCWKCGKVTFFNQDQTDLDKNIRHRGHNSKWLLRSTRVAGTVEILSATVILFYMISILYWKWRNLGPFLCHGCQSHDWPMGLTPEQCS